MKSRFLCALLFAGLFPAIHAEKLQPSVRLFTQNKQVAIPEVTQARLRQQVTDRLRSSNFHSGPGDKYHVFTFSGVQQDYRDTAASGQYLLVTLSPAQKISTEGGEVTAAGIIVGVSGHYGKNTVFTIDESGMIVSHAKYSGEVYLELIKTVPQSRP